MRLHRKIAEAGLPDFLARGAPPCRGDLVRPEGRRRSLGQERGRWPAVHSYCHHAAVAETGGSGAGKRCVVGNG